MYLATLRRLPATALLLVLPVAAVLPAAAVADAPPAQELRAATGFLDGAAADASRGTALGSGRAVPDALEQAPQPLPQADAILVRKGERRLYLLRRGEVLRSYRVALGLNPLGHKERAGDFRTPEGRYRIERRNPRSDFFLSMQVSYPNSRDAAHARRNGWQPGGSIMIHGLPNEPRKGADYYATQDWTDGCIALSNADMLEIWMLVSNNTPIQIEP